MRKAFLKDFRLWSRFIVAISFGVLLLAQPVKVLAAEGYEELPPLYPYQKTFIISAYYSPLPNQKHYVLGSYMADIKLNGRGTNGADGSEVYAGMIAAPKNYPFGTKMKIPGVGTVAVHDRGGAIVEAGKQNQSYDRLDIWMGYGDTGLQRALEWGKRTVAVTIYGIDPNLKEEVVLEGYSEAEKSAAAAARAIGAVSENAEQRGKLKYSLPPYFSKDLNLQDESEDVVNLQKALRALNFYQGEIQQKYDELTRQAVIKFQVDSGIIDSKDDFGAGYFGPQTRLRLGKAIERHKLALRQNLPQPGLSREDRGSEVKKLQEALVKLGYDVEPTGVYDESTVKALFQFQQENGIIKSTSDHGAGVFGPRTMAVLATAYVDANAGKTASESQIFRPLMVFTDDLKPGDKGPDVRKLQEELARMNLFGIESTGYYGDVTAHAIFKFQQVNGILKREDEPAAGILGPSTRRRLHSLMSERRQFERLIAEKQKTGKKKLVAVR